MTESIPFDADDNEYDDNDNTQRHLNPCIFRPEEKDCDIIDVKGGYKIEGYDADCLKNDYPFNKCCTSEEDTFEYVQKLAVMWHERYAMGNACFSDDASVNIITLGIPHPRMLISRGVHFVLVPPKVMTPLLQVSVKDEQNVGVCIMGIDLYTHDDGDDGDDDDDDEDIESFLKVVHIKSFSYAEFMSSDNIKAFKVTDTNESEMVKNTKSCWNCFNTQNTEGQSHDKKQQEGQQQEEEEEDEDWIVIEKLDVIGYLEASGDLNNTNTIKLLDGGIQQQQQGGGAGESEEIPIKESENQRKKRIRLFNNRIASKNLSGWFPDYRKIDKSLWPRVPFRAYECGHVPRFSRSKEEAQNYAAALGLGCFAFDFFNFNKKYIVCTWDAAWRIVHRRDTYTLPAGDRAFIEEGRGRHLYEGMMPEFPQKLILDLEYYFHQNPDLQSMEDVDRLTTYAIDYTSRFLEQMFSYTPSEEDWIILDSSSEEKASRHVILNAPNRYFRNMHDVVYFRDIMKAYMEAVILLRNDPAINLLVRAKPKKDMNGAIVQASSIADQVCIEGVWKTCFIDWGIVNHTFRLMRTCFASKYDQDDRPFVEATMNKQKYHNDRDLFINSLVSSVHPIFVDGNVDETTDCFKGWRVSKKMAESMISSVRTVLIQQGVASSSMALMTMVTQSPENNSSSTRKRKKKSSSVNVSDDCSSSSSHGVTVWKRGNLRKRELEADDIRHMICERCTKDAKPDLTPLIEETSCWRVWAVWDVEKPELDSSEHPRYFYISSHDSAYCPIKGTSHSSKGKMIIIITRRGKMFVKCFGGICQGKKWEFRNKKLSKKVIDCLWPKGLYRDNDKGFRFENKCFQRRF